MNTLGTIIKYPFMMHKHSGTWSLEHIHAQKSQGLSTVKQWRHWLEAHNEVLKDSQKAEWIQLSNKIAETLILDDNFIKQEIFDRHFEEIKQAMSDNNDKDEIHGIENMALLGKDDNAALNNAMFAVKRRKILELDKNGSYIPMCTRNVFLKYYNNDANNFDFWEPKDRETYLKHIKDTLKDYLPKPKKDSTNLES